jgi:hypothetical protein
MFADGPVDKGFTGFDGIEVADASAYTLSNWLGRAIAPQTIGEGVVVDIPPTESAPVPPEPKPKEPDAAE